MAPRLSLRAARSLSLRTKTPSSSLPHDRFAPLIQQRFKYDEVPKSPVPEGTKGPNTEQAPHVTEEQVAMDKTMGGTPPDIEQGTPVQEMLQRDSDAKDSAPTVIKEQMKKQAGQQKRSYSTSARRPAQAQEMANTESISLVDGTMIQGLDYPDAGLGHKFPLPDITNIPRTDHLKRRYDPLVDQVTKSLMRHGKLSLAQKNMAQILDALRSAPPPQINIAFPGRSLLLSDSASTNAASGKQITVPRPALPLHPVEYLTTIVDSVAPLVKIRQQRGVMGGGAALPLPIPLGIRQRRRQAIQWILGAADNRKETEFADRVAKEIINVAEGRSAVWERRAMVHKLAITARSNIKYMLQGPRRKR